MDCDDDQIEQCGLASHPSMDYRLMMKKITGIVLGILACAALYLAAPVGHAEDPKPDRPPLGTPPIGKLVDVMLVAWPLNTGNAGKVSGTLVAMSDQWIIVESGSQETWVPKEKVMTMTASR